MKRCKKIPLSRTPASNSIWFTPYLRQWRQLRQSHGRSAITITAYFNYSKTQKIWHVITV